MNQSQPTVYMKKQLFIGLFFLASAVISCVEQPVEPVDVSPNPNLEINGWIHDQMKTYYLWTDQMTPKASTDLTLSPDEYFESLLVKPGELDRFSWIEKSATELINSLQGRNVVLGVRTSAFFTNASQQNVAYAISYVLKGSPAEKAGLKRGDFITKVNNVALTPENYATALAPESLQLTLGTWNEATREIVPNDRVISVTKTEVQTNPIQFSTVVERENKKIGYLVYLQFLSAFDNGLREVFADFKAKGVNELVLDLRYNGGGAISSAVTLSSLIVKNLSENNIMYKDQWNKEITDYFVQRNGANFFNRYFKNEPDNLGSLQRVYVLTSRSTASASELVINSLKPYMEVIVIGDNTAGKNVGSITIQDENKRWEWGLQPIVLKTLNALGQSDYGTVNGFTPNIVQKDNVLPFQPFASENETLFRLALEHITQKPVASATAARLRAQRPMPQASREFLSDNPLENRKEMWITELPK